MPKKHKEDLNEDTITAEDVMIVAQKVTNDKSVKVLNYQLNEYSSDKLGLLGLHRNLTITLQRANTINDEVINLFVKSVPHDCKNQADFLNNDGIFIKESAFFRTIVPLLMENSKDERWSPICYLAKDDVLIMEDLKSQGFKVLGKSFDNIVTLKSALNTLARFHGCSMLLEAQLNRHSQDPISLDKRYANILKEMTFTREGRLGQWLSNSIKLVVTIAENIGYKDSDKLFNALNSLYDIVRPSKDYQNVIAHGDLWTNNLMFDDTKPIPKCILVDFQVIRYVPLVLDILQLLHLNTTREFRIKSETSLIEFYHSALEQTIKSNDSTKSVKVPTVNKIINGVEKFRLFGAAIAPLYFSIVFMDWEVLKENIKDSEGYNEFFFGDRTGLVLAYMEKDEFFKNKIKEVVTELLEVVEKL